MNRITHVTPLRNSRWLLAATIGLAAVQTSGITSAANAAASAAGPVSTPARSSLQGALGVAATQSDSSVDTSTVEVARAITPGIVTVLMFFEKRSRGGEQRNYGTGTVRVMRPGSGVVVDPTGLVLTNLHLVAELRGPDGAPSAEYWCLVSTSNGRQLEAELVAFDERTDLALLQLDSGRTRLKALPLGHPASLEPGERVIAASFPDGQAAQLFAGILAQPSGPIRLREHELAADETLLSDARFHASLDGGPLVDSAGRVLGLHNSSHVSALSESFRQPENEEDKKPNLDYAVIVSADAIRAAFGERLAAAETSGAPVEAPDAPFEAVGAISAIAPAIVSLWTGEGPHPTAPDLGDPHGQRPVDGVGSAVVITPDGLALTAAMLFPEDTVRGRVRMPDGTELEAELVVVNRDHKLALVRILRAEGAPPLACARLADSKTALQGEFVAVVARPYGKSIVSAGVLSALERKGFFQIASWLHRGHFGGAIVDRFGRLLAIATDGPEAGMREVDSTSFLGFAAPLGEALNVFAAELSAAGVVAPIADDDATRATRRGEAVVVAERLRSSLINVLVSREMPRASAGFNPFEEPEATYAMLGQGSGVVIDPSGLALTNWHVVSAALDGIVPRSDHLVEVTLPTGEKLAAQVLSASRDDDLALLALQLAPGQTVTPVVLGDSDALEVGQPVIAFGNPLGLSNSVSLGVVSRKSIDVMIQGRLREYEGMVMVDAAINPGNSGGPLLDREARLVGINSAGRVGAGMAIPVSRAKAVFADKLLRAESLRSSFVGFRVSETAGRLVVNDVEPLGPAAAVGIEKGDVITAVGERTDLSRVALAQALLAAAPGETLSLRVERAGEPLVFALRPLPFAAWNVFLQSGILVAEVDYATESQLVYELSVALHRSYTGSANGSPSRLMSGALRVTGVRALDDNLQPTVQVGDVILGMTTVTRGEVTDTHELRRFESLANLAEAFEPRATKEGEECELWIWRDGAVQTVRTLVRRAPR